MPHEIYRFDAVFSRTFLSLTGYFLTAYPAKMKKVPERQLFLVFHLHAC